MKIVISSSWGNFENKTATLLYKLGLELEVIGQTTQLHLQHDCICRGNEIKKWISDNIKHNEYYKYAILDDDSNMLLEQKNYFVKVDREIALTEKNINTIREILK